VHALAFSANSLYLACSSNTDTVHVFRLQTEYDLYSLVLCVTVLSYAAVVLSLLFHCCGLVFVVVVVLILSPIKCSAGWSGVKKGIRHFKKSQSLGS